MYANNTPINIANNNGLMINKEINANTPKINIGTACLYFNSSSPKNMINPTYKNISQTNPQEKIKLLLKNKKNKK